MTVGGILLAYAIAVATAGPEWFPRAGWTSRNPRLAIAVYLAACWSVLAAVVLAGLSLAVPTTALGGGISEVLGACIRRLRTAYFTPGGTVVAGLGLAISGLLLGRLTVALVGQVARTRRRTRRHVDLAVIAGRQLPRLGATVVEDEHAAAFCVAGGRPTIFVTTAAVEALTAEQLEAVLAHERAHLARRHHRLLTVASVLSRAFPALRLLREARGCIGRLIEMDADDVAARQHDAGLLARSLLLLATAPWPEQALGAGAGDTLARIHRLLAPTPPLSAARRRLTAASIGALFVLPLLFALTPAFVALAQGKVVPQ
jgi:hypothetical protein